MPPTLAVATANAASGRDARGRADATTWARWTEAAAALDVDVLAVQEVDHLLPRSGAVDQTAALARALADRQPAGPPPGGRGWHGGFAAALLGTPGSRATFRPVPPAADAAEPAYGIALLSRHPLRAWHELRLAPSRLTLPVPLPPGARPRVLWVPDEPRVAVAAVVAAPTGDVTVVTTHLSFSPLRARAQLRQVWRWCRDLPRPLVLLGDLNLPTALVVRATGATPALRAPTHPARRPRLQLDHVLLDDPAGRYAAADARVRRVADSDHLAVRVALEARP